MEMTLRKSWSFINKDLNFEFQNIRDWANKQNQGSVSWDRFFLQGSMTLPIRIVTSGTALADLDYFLSVNSSSSQTVTLPNAVVMMGRTYIVMSSGDGQVTISTTNSQTINGGSSVIIPAKYFHYQFFSDGSNWLAI